MSAYHNESHMITLTWDWNTYRDTDTHLPITVMVLIGMAWVRATTISVFWQKSGCLRILSKWAIKQQIYLNSIIHRWTVVSYPSCVGGERRLSPPTQPGYEAKVDRNTEIAKVDLPRLWISRVSSGSSGLWSLVRTQALRACCPGKWALGLLTAVRKTSQEKQPGSSVVVAISSVHAYMLPKPQNTYVVKWRPRCVVLLKIKTAKYVFGVSDCFTMHSSYTIQCVLERTHKLL